MPPPAEAFGPPIVNEVTRERWIVFSKHKMRTVQGNSTTHNSEVPNSEHFSRAFPMSGREDMLAFADLFMNQDYLLDDLPATSLLREFFLPNAIRPTIMTFPKRNSGGGRVLGWAETPALEFYAIVKANEVKNDVVLQDPLDWRAIARGPGHVSVSMTIPMATDEDKMHFVQSLTGGFLLDFMCSKSRVHLTNYTYKQGRQRIYQMWQPMVETPDEDQEEEDEDDWGEGEPAQPPEPDADPEPGDGANPDNAAEAPAAEQPVEDAVQARRTAMAAAAGEGADVIDLTPFGEASHSLPEDSASSSDDEAPANEKDKEVIQVLMSNLFDRKEDMSEGMYVAVSNSLKRRHDQIGR